MKRFTMFAAAAALMLTGASGVQAQDPATLGGHPNLNGVWQALNTANYNLEPHSAGEAPAASRQIGATGAIISVKAIHELHRTGGRYALVTMCIGGGQGIAAIFERVQ